MNVERWFLRCFLTVLTLIIGAVMAPVMVALKMVEGVYVCWCIMEKAIAQVWGANGIQDFDPTTKK